MSAETLANLDVTLLPLPPPPRAAVVPAEAEEERPAALPFLVPAPAGTGDAVLESAPRDAFGLRLLFWLARYAVYVIVSW